MIAIWLMAGPRGLPKDPRANLREIIDSTRAAFSSISDDGPVIIIGGITTGFAATGGVVVLLYAAGLGFLYKDLKLKDLPAILFTSLKQTCGLMFIIATANLSLAGLILSACRMP